MKAYAAGTYKRVDVLDPVMTNWLGEVIGEELLGRDVLTTKLKQTAVLAEDDTYYVSQSNTDITVVQRVR